VALTAGCTQLLSINEDALVVGVGLDAARPPDHVLATLQWFHHGTPAGGGGGSPGSAAGGGGGGMQLLTLSAGAPDVASAVEAVGTRTDQRVTFYVTDLVILGEDLARGGAAEPVDYLWRSGDMPESAEVAVARGTAAQLLRAPFPGGTALELERRLVRSDATNTGSIPIPLWRFLARAASTGEAAWAPMFAATPNGFEAAGTALFVGDRLAGELGQDQTAALSWLLKGGGYGDLVLPRVTGADGEPVALRVRSRALSKSVHDPTAATLNLSLVTEVIQGAGVIIGNRSPAVLEAEAASQATLDLRAVLDGLQAAGSDVLGLGEILRERDPAAATDWPERFRRMDIALRVRVRILPGGRQA
jgi:hypothetical protein